MDKKALKDELRSVNACIRHHEWFLNHFEEELESAIAERDRADKKIDGLLAKRDKLPTQLEDLQKRRIDLHKKLQRIHYATQIERYYRLQKKLNELEDSGCR